MLTLFCSAFSVICSLCCILIYKRIAWSTPTLRQIEHSVAKEMEGRAHRLCMQAYEAQRVGNAFERKRYNEEFQDNLHLYVEDYQAEVALKLKEHKVRNIPAYGYIWIMK